MRRILRRMRRILLIAVVLLGVFRSSLSAQIGNHLPVVEAVKTSLQGQDLSGPCGAFKITHRVAWQLRDEGAGLLFKPTGNQCEQRSTDIVMYVNGRIFDVLIDGGGSNTPAWNEGVPVDPALWRAATDPGNTPTPPMPSPLPDLSPILDRLAQLEHSVHLLQDTSSQIEQRQQILENRVQVLEAHPRYTRCHVSFFGIRLGCRLEE